MGVAGAIADAEADNHAGKQSTPQSLPGPYQGSWLGAACANIAANRGIWCAIHLNDLTTVSSGKSAAMMTRIASTRLIGIPHSAVAITAIECSQSGKMKGMIGRASDAGPTLPPFTEETFSVESCDRLPRISLEWLLIDAKGMPRGDPERRLGLVEAIGHSPARAVGRAAGAPRAHERATSGQQGRLPKRQGRGGRVTPGTRQASVRRVSRAVVILSERKEQVPIPWYDCTSGLSHRTKNSSA